MPRKPRSLPCSQCGAKAVEFYKKAFDARELFCLDNEGEVIAQLAGGEDEFWIADESPEHKNVSRNRCPLTFAEAPPCA
jgi:uncharacterized glyoxalase superfamily protein PhnB